MAKIKGMLKGESVVLENSSEAALLHKKSHFGSEDNGMVLLSLLEAAYLLKKGKVEVIGKGKKSLGHSEFSRTAKARIPGFREKCAVYSALREKGYCLKSGFKFGADFLAYQKGKAPGKSHSDWAVFCASENKRLSASGFSARARIANTTKKKLLLAFVDNEGEASFYEVKWLRI